MKKYIKSISFALALLLSSSFAFAAAPQFLNTVVSLTGTVIDHVTRKPISVNMVITDANGQKVNKARSNSSDGYYLVTGLKPGKTYKVTLEESNYFKEEYQISVPNTDKYLEISKDYLVKPMYNNAKLPIPVPPFELNKSKIRVGADIFLQDFYTALKINPTVKIEILAYADNDKDQAANAELTKSRADALKEYFVKKGIKEDRISVRGANTTDPKMPPPSGRAAKGKRYVGSTYLVLTSF